MPVNNISSFSCFGISQSAQNTLSEETKRKLQALGIDPTTVTSETQAQTLIAASKQKVQEPTNESLSRNTCCSGECELIAKAKILASKIGVQTSTNDPLQTIIDKISAKITTLTANSENSDNQENLNQYKNELTTIENEYSQIKQNQNSLLNAMTITANMNRFLLGIK